MQNSWDESFIVYSPGNVPRLQVIWGGRPYTITKVDTKPKKDKFTWKYNKNKNVEHRYCKTSYLHKTEVWKYVILDFSYMSVQID